MNIRSVSKTQIKITWHRTLVSSSSDDDLETLEKRSKDNAAAGGLAANAAAANLQMHVVQPERITENAPSAILNDDTSETSDSGLYDEFERMRSMTWRANKLIDDGDLKPLCVETVNLEQIDDAPTTSTNFIDGSYQTLRVWTLW